MENKVSKSFVTALNTVLIESMFNNYTDNYDFYRFGPAVAEKKQVSPKSLAVKWLNKKGYFSIESRIDYIRKKLIAFDAHIGHFNYLYDLLEDDYSKELLVKVCAFRMLGNKKIKLPMNNPEFWDKVSYIENKLADRKNAIQAEFLNNWSLYLTDLNPIGYPIKIYSGAIGVYYDFIYHCYFYKRKGIDISVKKGDHVIDAGACFGDTALLFAHYAGTNGRVYSFEFVPNNLKILSRNLDVNPDLKERIKLIKQPLWSEEGIPVYYESNGPGTKVSMQKISDKSSLVNTATIDSLVEQGNIEKVDFIKMDIEGAETNALVGAEKTIKKFKPKLAISLYHSELDFKRIPEFIKSLNLGYKFYFDHYTMHAEESVLFCTI